MTLTTASLFDQIELRINNAETERAHHRKLVKLLSVEIRELKSVLASHQKVIKQLPKEETIQGVKGGQSKKASGAHAELAG